MKKLTSSILAAGLLFNIGNVALAAEENNDCNIKDAVNISFYGEDKGYYENKYGNKIILKNAPNVYQVDKIKDEANKIINEHINDLCDRGLNIEKLLKDNPLEIEMFPYKIEGYHGFYFDNSLEYFHPEEKLGIVQYKKDKIVYVSQENLITDKNYTFDNLDLEYVLTHEFAHYIDYNLFNSNDIMEFLEIKNLQNDKTIVGNIRKIDAVWEEKPSEIFAENYVQFFMNKESRIFPLKEKEVKIFEDFLFDNIN